VPAWRVCGRLPAQNGSREFVKVRVVAAESYIKESQIGDHMETIGIIAAMPQESDALLRWSSSRDCDEAWGVPVLSLSEYWTDMLVADIRDGNRAARQMPRVR